MIPYGRQDISEDDINSVVKVLESEYLTQGPVVPFFEEAISNYCGVNFGVGANSATSALHIACLALGLGPGDELWTSPNSFVATANCGVYCGATVDFVDVDPKTYNMCPQKLAEKLSFAEKVGRLPKIVIPVHFAGQSCEMLLIQKLSQKYGFKLIEDASHALGAQYLGQKVGNCRFSDITVFSFHPIKMITTGEGGIAVTNDPIIADKLKRFRSHGVTSELAQMAARPKDEIWNFQQTHLGYNYRMTDISAALGLSQLKRLDLFVKKRREIAKQYDDSLSSFPVIRPWQHQDCMNSYHLYPICLKLEELNNTQPQIFSRLRDEGILVNLHYIPIYRHPFYETSGFKAGYCPEAERYFKRALSLPIFYSLNDEQHNIIISKIEMVLNE